MGICKQEDTPASPELDAIRDAAARITSSIIHTPFLKSETLSELTGCEIWLKFENLQFTGSFKERGALNKLLSLDEASRRRGVVTVSAGNHAQGVALHARRLGIPATIIMPDTTPTVKVKRTESFGATVRLSGRDFAEASAEVDAFVARGLTFIHPFDDADVIAGQGTIGLELLEQGPCLDTVITAVGGGGMIAGISTVFRALSPETKIIGVESELYPSMAQATGQFADGIPKGLSIAEGIAVAEPGSLTLDRVRRNVDEVLVVSEAAIEDALALLLQIEKTLCEGAGAAGLASVLSYPERFQGQKVGLVLSGGNIDLRVLCAMLQRHLARTGQLVRLQVPVLDNGDSIGPAAAVIGRMGGNILEIRHDRVFDGASARMTNAVFTVELPDTDRNPLVMQALSDAGFAVSELGQANAA